jgi:hypothetical protein
MDLRTASGRSLQLLYLFLLLLTFPLFSVVSLSIHRISLSLCLENGGKVEKARKRDRESERYMERGRERKSETERERERER